MAKRVAGQHAAWVAIGVLAACTGSPPDQPDPDTEQPEPERVVTGPVLINLTELAARAASTPRAAPTRRYVPAPLAGPIRTPAAERQRVVEAPSEIPHALPIHASAPSPAASFLALDDINTSIPPDTHGAAGPNHVMTVLNTEIHVQDRAGTSVTRLGLDAFWTDVLGAPMNAFDPKVLYDPYGGRWIFTACGNARSADSAVLIAASETDDPSGNWYAYSIDADGADIVWADYPSFGFNQHWVAVNMNMFAVSNNAFHRTETFFFRRPELYAGMTAPFNVESSSNDFSLAPAITMDATEDTLYLVEHINPDFLGSGYIGLYTATDDGSGDATIAFDTYVSTPNPWSSRPSGGLDFAPQLDSGELIQTNDARMQNVVFRNGELWAAHTIFLPAGGTPTRSSIQWWHLAADGTILERDRIDDPAGLQFYAYPTIAVNKASDVAIGFARFAADIYAAGGYVFRAAREDHFRDEVVLKAGEASYYKTFSGTRNRWGDYSSTVIDPVDDCAFWTIQEFAALPSGGWDRWGTWWGQVAPPNSAPVVDAIADPAPIPQDSGAQTVMLSGIGTGTNCDPKQNLSLGAVSSDPMIVPHPTADPISGTTSALHYQPAPGAFGTVAITVTLSDDGGTANGGVDAIVQTFEVVVEPLCGNSVVDAGETCDDGNMSGGDGCGATCQIEPRTVDLSAGPADRTLLGAGANKGFANLAIGDLDDDGVDDLAGASINNVIANGRGRNQAGTVVVYAGGPGFFDGTTTTIPTGALAQVLGADPLDHLGGSRASGVRVGDVTGDGVDDLVVSAAGADGADGRDGCGEVFVLPGGPALTGTIDLATAPVGARIIGAAAGDAIVILAIADLDGDGTGDLLIGTPGDDTAAPNAGGAVILFGGAGLAAGTVHDLSTASVTVIRGPAQADAAVGGVGAAGDIGGTTAGDLMLGALGFDVAGRINTGAVWALFGPFAPGTTIDLETTFDARWFGATSYDKLGSALAIGNALGDGRDDALIGALQARNAPAPGNQVGATDIWAGPITGGTTFDLGDPMPPVPDARIRGAVAGDQGGAVHAAADMNGDGFHDVLFCSGLAGAGAGECSLVLGGAGLTGTIDIADVNASPNLRLLGSRARGFLARSPGTFAFGNLDGTGRIDVCVGSEKGGPSFEGKIDCVRNAW